MAKSFVSVFKLDGVPILPPVMNDDVRAMVAVYRQKAIEIEKRLRERKRGSTESVAKNRIESLKESSDPVVEESTITQKYPVIEIAADSQDRSLTEQSYSLETTGASSRNTTIEYEELPDTSVSLQRELSRTLTPAKQVSDCNVAHVSITSAAQHPVPKESSSKEIVHEATESQMAKSGTLTFTTTSKTDLPSWQTSTRTVTPTSDESLPWLPLVRSNTYNLEKPTIDLQSLLPPNHSTPVDPNRNISGKTLTRSVSQPAPPRPKAHIGNGTVNLGKKEAVMALHDNLTPVKQKATGPSSGGKVRSKRISSSRTVSNCSADSANDRSFDSVANVLTSHEQRMVELLRRQEEERLLLEKSFRAKTQELVALCAKSLTTEGPVPKERSLVRTPEFDPASSVSQLSLCDVSYDSCTDTDDAAYQTCHANGTSEENVADIENILNNSLAKPFNDRAIVRAKDNSCDLNRTRDVNGNEQIAMLPQRMHQLQQHRAATIINAHVRGYLTRRLLQTEEVQTIKQTIIDILCFIVQSRSRKPNATDASVRRSAGKHITFCLDRLHDIFVNYSPAQRIQMIRRDRYLKNKTVGPK